MTKDRIIFAGQLNSAVFEFVPGLTKYSGIYRSEGLIKHIEKRHPDCVRYLSALTAIIEHPDYMGRNPNEQEPSVELVKTFDENVQIGIKLDVKDNYLYVATLHTITDSKLKHRLESGRLKRLIL